VDVVEELRAIERRRLQALVDGAMDIAMPLHAPDYQLVNGGGGVLSRDEYLGAIASGELRYVVFEAASEIVVRHWDDVAAMRYLARIDVRFGTARDAGHFWHTDLYERAEGRWRVIWSQATPTADRDRTPVDDAG
jgi:hypothetical protein